MNTRFCKACNRERPASDFLIRKSGLKKGHYRTTCKYCENEQTKKRQLLMRDVYLANKRINKRLNRDKYNFYERKRKFILRSPALFGSHTMEEWQLLKVTHGFKCLCCGMKEPDIRLTEDHITPISKGGSNSIENIQPLCIKCNQIKNSKTIRYNYDSSIKS